VTDFEPTRVPAREHRVEDGPALPRELIFLASLWMVGSWVVAIGIRPPLQPSASSYTPGVRTMLLCIMIGLAIAWPLMRVSQAPTHWPIRRVLLDLVALLALAQVIIWPVRLVTVWSVERTFAIAVFVAGWTALVGAVIAVSTAVPNRNALSRAMGMAVCCAFCVLGPGVGWILAAMASTRGSGLAWDGALAPWLGPLIGLHTLTAGGVAPLSADDWRAISTTLAAAVAAWIAAPILIAIGRRIGGRDAGTSGIRPLSS